MGPNHILVYQWVVNPQYKKYEVQCGNKVRSCTYYCIVNVSVIVLYNVVYDFRVLEMHVDACVSIHSK